MAGARPVSRHAPGRYPQVRVKGWVRTMRQSKNFAFIELNDGSFFRNLQLVLEEANLPEYREIVKKVGVGAAIEAQGLLALTRTCPSPSSSRCSSWRW